MHTLLLKDKISIILSAPPNVRTSSGKCCANFDEALLFLKDKWRSLYLFIKLLPVWPTQALLIFYFPRNCTT